MLKTLSKLIRLEQWYKNVIIFAPLLFSPDTYPPELMVLGFLGFSCVSSVTYIFNDWMDREKDRLHPIKKERPLASGKISGKQAVLVAALLLLAVLGIVYMLGIFYGSILLTYFVITNLYSLGLKNIPLLDIVIIGGNFAMRMMAGLQHFPDMSTLPYFGLLLGAIVIFLTHKRSNDIKLLGDKALKHKPVLRYYTRRNNYFYRAVGYAVVILSFFVMWRSGLSYVKIVGLFIQLMATSFIFSDNPEYTSKPQWLFRSKLWVGVLVGTVVLWGVVGWWR
jgi:4-hydroxybenzoate polyprenyltransferase